MVKKLKQMAEKQAASGKSLFDNALAGSVKESASQIWLAGLGAFARAQAEGTKMFESLVKEGATLQKKTQAGAEEKIGEVASKVSSMAGEVQAKYGQQWDKLEGIFEERTAKALGKLGVPSAKDVQALSLRVDELSAQVGKLSKTPSARAAAAPASARNNGPARPATKRAPARKSAAA